jgi:hypothetical protein
MQQNAVTRRSGGCVNAGSALADSFLTLGVHDDDGVVVTGATLEPTGQETMNRILAASGLALFVLFASSASAEPIAYSSVGVEDLLVTGSNLGNSDQAEQDFLFNYMKTLGEGYDPVNYTFQKINIGGTASFVEVTGDPLGTNLWAIDFASYGITSPTAFLVRIGNAEYDHYLYSNVGSLQYGVVDLADINPTRGNITISSLSHTSVVVPEPATLSLLVFGMVGAGIASSKRRRQLA